MKIILLVLLFPFVFISCVKDESVANNTISATKCEGKCIEIIVNGRVIDKSTGLGIQNELVELVWASSLQLPGSVELIKSQVTDVQGNFMIKASIDSSKFRNAQMNVRISNSAEYVTTPFQFNDYSYFKVYNYSSTIDGMYFDRYPKADLKIKLHKVTTDSLLMFKVEHTFDYIHTRLTFGDYLYMKQDPEEMILNVETASGFITTIKSAKEQYVGGYVEQYDTITCEKGRENIVDIYW